MVLCLLMRPRCLLQGRVLTGPSVFCLDPAALSPPVSAGLTGLFRLLPGSPSFETIPVPFRVHPHCGITTQGPLAFCLWSRQHDSFRQF